MDIITRLKNGVTSSGNSYDVDVENQIAYRVGLDEDGNRVTNKEGH